MNTTGKITIVAVLIIAIAAVVNLKRSQSSDSGVVTVDKPVEVTTNAGAENSASTISESSKALPHLVDIGSDTCIPCKMMAPILDELKKEYAGSIKVDFLDIKTNPAFAEEYGIRLIPTQIFYDTDGKERFRHEGFMSKEDILAKWAELGVELTKAK
jgi:thioredoxin 1